MKIALAQINFHIGNFEKNSTQIIEAIAKAKAGNAELVVFSELAICGYPPADLLEFDSFIIRCKKEIEEIAKHCDTIAAVIGAPSFNPDKTGKRLYNSAYILEEGKISAVYNKGLLPDYDVFDEYRYFQPAEGFKTINIKGNNVAITVCEDLWNIGERKLYKESPMEILSKQDPSLIINVSASPFSCSHALTRKQTMCENASHYDLPLIHVNQVGGNTDILFDGGSLVVNKKGKIALEMNYFGEDFKIIDTDKLDDKKGNSDTLASGEEQKISRIHDALIMGIKDFFAKLGFKKAILGLSGGLDSAIVMVLAAKALGADNVRAVLMPGPYSSKHSVADAEALAKNLGADYDIISINETYNTFLKTLQPSFSDTPFGIAEENIQARARAVILMAISNKYGHVLLNTSNKSEAAVGYGTLYGDMCGGLAVIGDVYKTDIYKLAHYINKEQEVIPLNTIEKPPSAELRPDQKDSDSLPEYDLLDDILNLYIEGKKGQDEIMSRNFDPETVKKVIRLVNLNEYKRHQTAPVLRVSRKSFGIGRRMPIVAKYDI